MKDLHSQTVDIRSELLKRYYRTAALGWFEPKSLHWAKVVTQEGYWKWTKAINGVRGRLLKDPPLHVYQTVLRIKSRKPPRGSDSSGYFLGGPLIFDMDLIPKDKPFSLWQIMDIGESILELVEHLGNLGEWKLDRVMFSGSRGVHAAFTNDDTTVISLRNRDELWKLRDFKRERKQTARSIGYWCGEWDWRVTADLWRVSRVPWSIHGSSSLRAIPLKPPFSSKHIQEQIREASVFTNSRHLRVRLIRDVSSFTFIDGSTYGPFTRGWATTLPISVALHLLWKGYAKPREHGPKEYKNWFSQDWQTLFRYNSSRLHMVADSKGGLDSA